MTKKGRRELFTCVEVDIETVEHLKMLFKENTSSKAVKKALEMFCKYDIDLIRSMEFDKEYAYQMPERMKQLLCAASGQRNWQNAVNDLVIEYLDKQYPSVK
jgi:hypothetical protein